VTVAQACATASAATKVSPASAPFVPTTATAEAPAGPRESSP